MSVDMKLVKKLREQTGVGILDCKKAVSEAENDFAKAEEILRKRGLAKAQGKASRATNQGGIASYIHSNYRIGVLLELGCETDFVAKNEDFLALQKDICMQIAAMEPRYVSSDEIPEEVLAKEKEIFAEQMKNSGKPDNIIDKIVEGKMTKLYGEICLLNQTFFKDDTKTIQDLIAEGIHKLGENIAVKRFVRYAVGETAEDDA